MDWGVSKAGNVFACFLYGTFYGCGACSGPGHFVLRGNVLRALADREKRVVN